MTKTEQALQRTQRRLGVAKWVAFVCVAAVLLIVNTDLLPGNIAFWVTENLLTIGGLAFVVGIWCAAAIPQLERTVLRELNDTVPLARALRPERGRSEDQLDIQPDNLSSLGLQGLRIGPSGSGFASLRST